MAQLESLVYDILARDQASTKFRDVGNAAERAGKQTSTFGSTVGSAMKLAAGAFLGAGLIQGFKALYDAADESRKIAALTGAVIKSTGGAANVSAKQVSDLASAIAAKTGVDDEAIQSGQNLLLTFTNVRNETGKGNDIFNQATQAVTDMSVALGKDAPASATLLGKALNDPIKGMGALSRAGVQFTQEQKEQIRTLVESGDVLGAQKIILEELGTQFGGAAEAAATPLDKLRVRAGNLAEQVGGYLIPAIDKFATFLSDRVLPGLESTGDFLQAVAIPVFSTLGTVVGAIADAFNALPAPLQIGLVALGAFAALRGPVGGALETIGLKALYMRDSFAQAGGGIGGFKAAGAGLIGFLGGPWGIAIGGATAGLGLLSSWLDKADTSTQDVKGAQEGFAAALRESKGALDENVRAAAAKAAQDAGILDAAEAAGISVGRVTDALLGNRTALNEVRTALQTYADAKRAAYIEGGSTTLEAERLAALDAKDALAELAPTIALTAAEQRQLEEATSTGAVTVETFAGQMEEARAALDEGKRAIDDFKLSLDLLTGQTVSIIEVEAAFQGAVASSVGAMQELGGAVLDSAGKLNLQSENGRKAADVLLDVRNSGNELIATMLEQGATTDEVAAKDAELRTSFINTAKQMGISDQAALDLANQILGIPEERTTAISADTSAAQTAIDGLVNSNSGRVIKLGVATATGDAAVNIAAGKLLSRATGGPVFGPGTGTSDSIPAMLSNGEYVVNAKATSYNRELLEAINSGRVGQFAAGGIVTKVTSDTSGAQRSIDSIVTALANSVAAAGTGGLTGQWMSIWNYVKGRVPQARINSTYRPGDPGYHGRNKAIDFGFGTGPGGAGSAGLALINRVLHDGVGRNLAELIYDGIGDDRPDLKNGRPLTYSASTQAQHRNHVHAAVYDGGGLLPPGLTVAYNGTGQNETIRTAAQEAALRGPLELSDASIEKLAVAMMRGAGAVVGGALTAVADRGQYN